MNDGISNNQRVLSTQDASLLSCGHPPEHDALARRRIRREGIYGLGETYQDGLWTCDRLDEYLTEVFRAPAPRLSPFAWSRMILAAIDKRIFNRQSGRGAFNIGEKHYDLGNDLFEKMLDRSMSYTCGYWASADSLEQAQDAKLDLICRKLGLTPGQHILDIGCGWGNFAEHAARHYGVRVTGVTVSRDAKICPSRFDFRIIVKLMGPSIILFQSR